MNIKVEQDFYSYFILILLFITIHVLLFKLVFFFKICIFFFFFMRANLETRILSFNIYLIFNNITAVYYLVFSIQYYIHK